MTDRMTLELMEQLRDAERKTSEAAKMLGKAADQAKRLGSPEHLQLLYQLDFAQSLEIGIRGINARIAKTV